MDEEARLALQENPRSLTAAIRAGERTFHLAGGPLAYFGDPARASRAEGETSIAVLGEILAEAVGAALA